MRMRACLSCKKNPTPVYFTICRDKPTIPDYHVYGHSNLRRPSLYEKLSRRFSTDLHITNSAYSPDISMTRSIEISGFHDDNDRFVFARPNQNSQAMEF